jgi:hypothetical protein
MSLINADTLELINIHLGEYKNNKITIENIIFYGIEQYDYLYLYIDAESIYPIGTNIHQKIKQFFESFLFLRIYLRNKNSIIRTLTEIKSLIIEFSNKFNPILTNSSLIYEANEWFKKCDIVNDDKKEKFKYEYFGYEELIKYRKAYYADNKSNY